MNRDTIARVGAAVGAGFVLSSAVANFLFGLSLGRTPLEGALIGAVGILAVAMNALCPFLLSSAITASQRLALVSIIALWLICLVYSATAALGFAAQNREGVTVSRQIKQDTYEDTRRELTDLEHRRNVAKAKDRARLDARIDAVRKRLTVLRNDKPVPADAQSAFLSALTFGLLDPRHVRIALVVLFTVMVEMGASLGFFAAVSHSLAAAAPVGRWKPGTG